MYTQTSHNELYLSEAGGAKRRRRQTSTIARFETTEAHGRDRQVIRSKEAPLEKPGDGGQNGFSHTSNE